MERLGNWEPGWRFLFALLLVKMSVPLVLVHLLKFLGHRNGQHNGAKSLLMPRKTSSLLSCKLMQ